MDNLSQAADAPQPQSTENRCHRPREGEGSWNQSRWLMRLACGWCSIRKRGVDQRCFGNGATSSRMAERIAGHIRPRRTAGRTRQLCNHSFRRSQTVETGTDSGAPGDSGIQRPLCSAYRPASKMAESLRLAKGSALWREASPIAEDSSNKHGADPAFAALRRLRARLPIAPMHQSRRRPRPTICRRGVRELAVVLARRRRDCRGHGASTAARFWMNNRNACFA